MVTKLVLRADAETVAARIREIAELMGAGQWIVGVTENQLAERWGITSVNVRNHASEARRLVAHAYGDTEDIRNRVLIQLDGIASEVRKKEPRTAVAALMGIATIAGLVQRERPGTGTEPSTKRHLSPTERLEEISRIRAALELAEEQAKAELKQTIDVPTDPARDT